MKRSRKNHSRSRERKGFALVVAISLMSFILLLIVGMSTLTQVELASASSTNQFQRAQENARLGLLVALGELQKTAGPDQRVTARAEILGDGNYAPENRYWTGVWDTTNMAAPPTWLVSGSRAVTEVPNGDSFPLVKPASDPVSGLPIPAMTADAVEVYNGNEYLGDYAFWVSGENDKIATSKARFPTNSSADKKERRLSEYQGVASPDFNFVIPSTYNNGTDDQFNFSNESDFGAEIARAISTEQLSLAKRSDGSAAFSSISGSDFYHDLSLSTWSVLADTRDGGLKKNLFDESLTDPLAGPTTRDFLDGLAIPLESNTKSFSNLADGKPYLFPRPIPTEITLWMGIFHTWSDGKVRARFHVQAEFWNPYGAPIIFPADTDSRYNRAFIVEFENLPIVTVRDATRRSTTPILIEDLNSLSNYPANDNRRNFNSWIDVEADSKRNRPELLAGEVWGVTEPNPESQPRGLVRIFGTERWSENAETRPDDSATIAITGIHPSEGVTIRVLDYATEEPIFTITDLPYDDFIITKTFRNSGDSDDDSDDDDDSRTGDSDDDADSFSRPTSSSYTIADYILAYHFRLYTDGADPGFLQELMDGLDPRDPEIAYTDSFVDSDGNKREIADFIVPTSFNPADAAQNGLNMFSSLDIFYDPEERSHDNPNRVIFYDVPRDTADFVSLGSLRFLPRWQRSSMLLGTTHDNSQNRIFDDFFVPTPHLTTFDITSTIPAAELASRSYVEGAFNINSTSIPAWAAFLSKRMAVDPEDNGSSEFGRHIFVRHPFYAAENPEFEDNEADLKIETGFGNLPPSYSQGLRQLDPDRGEGQIQFLAEQIVQGLRTRGLPYTSIEEFLGDGLLESILERPSSEGGSDINDQIHKNSNVYVTQSDIIAQRADVVTPRSDTFLIRSYGNSRNEFTGDIVGEAWAEAVVRRTANKAGNINANATATQPRDFEIVSWRWLEKSEVQ